MPFIGFPYSKRDMARDIDIALLRAFTSVVETGSVTGAARLLGRTQAAVSLQIKRLEEQLGVALFAREHRKLTLTAAGERLVAGAEKLVTANDELWTAMTKPAFRGAVRLGVPMDILPTYIPPVLRRFNQGWPQVEVTVECRNSSDLLEALDRGEVDVTLTTDTHEHLAGARITETLRKDRLVWVGVPGGRSWRQEPLPLAVGSRSCRFRPVALDALRKAGRTWRLVTEVSNELAQKAVVQADIAVGADLRDSIPSALIELGPEAGLPVLPQFSINLSLPATGGTEVARELARHIRLEFRARFGDPEEAA